MPNCCLYLQLHQPYRLTEFSLLDIGHRRSYFKRARLDANAKIFRKVSRKSYRPMLRLLIKLVADQPGFKVALSCSGVFLEQAATYDPVVLKLLQRLAQSEQVEFLGETYYHSLASLYSPTEFAAQVKLHRESLRHLLGVTPVSFRNTELIYDNTLPVQVKKLQFSGLLTEAVSKYLAGAMPAQPFSSVGPALLPLLLKNAALSDDIAFRFSNQDWKWYPLSVDRYFSWLEQYQATDLINLFMDFETFGEHQWAETGIFTFFTELVMRICHSCQFQFVLPRDIWSRLTAIKQLPVYNVTQPISWADIDRDTSAWTENPLQQDCLAKLYALEKPILASGDQALIDDWRKLQTSDHFYYMCIKWSADGDVHAYFSPYDSPYEAYRRYSIVLADLQERLL